jgi:hypothetical protein
MAQSQATKPTTTTAIVTSAQSLSLMRNVLRVSLSEICFIRNIFPSRDFEKVQFGNTDVRVLKRETADEPVSEAVGQLLKLEGAAADALSLGYLR